MTERAVRLFNALTGQEEVFVPREPGRATLYVCGVTPYDECHLGHARCYVVFDFIRRALTRLGYVVRHVQNFTDIDDKIIARAAERGETPARLAERYMADYFDKMDRLNVLRADSYPRVTEHIPAIVALIERLAARGLAYVEGGDVFFSVRKWPSYGRLSRRDVEDARAGARVEVDLRKQDPLDFALWKSARPGEPSWPSPWGPGRPGWHIECSAMCLTAFQENTIDIHGGGQDLLFPHHENEIAQSEGATGRPFARYWIHNGFVTVNKEKMSKSTGRYFALSEVFRAFDPRVVRFFLMGHHHRSPLEYSTDQMDQARLRLTELDEDMRRLEACLKSPREAKPREVKALSARLDAFPGLVDDALAENFNAPRVWAAVFELLGDLKARAEKPKALSADGLRRGLALVRDVCEHVLGIPVSGAPESPPDGPARALIDLREAARKEKNWAEADRLRMELGAQGIVVEDTPHGPRWWRTGHQGPA